MPYSKQDKQPQFDVTYSNLIVHMQIKGTTALQVTLLDAASKVEKSCL